ncbi:hypothetical protein K438DRAFT_1913379 [Mycena galopus ATCC 62051]|nr:hypothetical protein K438DRAFT_1913379 [Mycena galopus ATCC 62051]
MDGPQLAPFAQEVLLNAFRTHYQRFQNAVSDLVGSHTDAIVIEQLGDDIDEFANMVAEASISTTKKEPVIVQTIRFGGPGCPRIHIDPDFLQWAYGQFLGVGRATVRNALLEYGIAEPQQSPFQPLDAASDPTEADPMNNDILDPNLPIPSGDFPPEVEELAAPSQPTTSFTGPMSDISDDDLDMLLLRLRTHCRRADQSMLDGMLRRLGHRVSIERIRQSLLRIDPVRRIFERIRIRRRDYRVLGPNSLWHHDGQHGESVHNVRIERLWVDVTAQVSATWGDHFTLLEVRYGLDINNVAHIWLLHFLFLGTINTQLTFFAESWNQHRIQIQNGPNRSPTDMFVFDMYVNGVRGNQLPQEEEDLGEDELEVYGIDWQAQNNSSTEGSSSSVGRTGPPPDLSQVIVQPPVGTLTEQEATNLYNSFSHLIGSAHDGDIILLWNQALAHVRVLYPDVF